MDLQGVIKDGIDHWLERRPGKRSIHSLAKKAGVKYSTLINLYNQVANPPIERIVPVLLIIFGSGKAKSIIKEYKPELLHVYSQILGLEKDKSIFNDEDEELYDLLEDKEYFAVYLLCITTGIQSEALLYLFGNSYRKALKDLVDRSFVEFSNGRYFAKNNFISFPSLKKALSFIAHGLSLFNAENTENGSRAFFATHNVSYSDLEKINNLQKDYQQKLMELLESTDEHGGLCWYYGSFFDIIDPNDKEEVEI